MNLLDGTISLLELNNDLYYFNGVKVFISANHVAQARRKLVSLMDETGLTYEEVMMEYTLEVLAALLVTEKLYYFDDTEVQILEGLGLEHLPTYTEDFLAFFTEKTNGKKEKTVRKYRESLNDLNEVLKRNQYISLQQLDEDSWRRILSIEYFDMYEMMTKTQMTDLFSTLKAFIQWMEKNKKALTWDGLAGFLKEEENQFVHAVQFPNSFFPNLHGNVGLKMNELAKMFKGEIAVGGQIVEGLFEIIKKNKQSFRVAELDYYHEGVKRKEYTISGSDIQIDYAEEGLIFSGKITKGRINMWELFEINNVYPRTAKSFILQKQVLR